MNEPMHAWVRLLDLDAAAEPWNKEDLAAMWRHQLAAALKMDLRRVSGVEVVQLLHAARSCMPAVESFQDLLDAVTAPQELYEAAKQFARSAGQPGGDLPAPLATGLYFAVIAAALRQNRRISTLSDTELRDGFAWTAAQAWVDPGTRTLCQAAIQKILSAGNQ